ncbi:hypothetical protein [Nonomuraea sp. NPDC049400]|uniref:hypothetical protein n=1 Tax=Nonomuraea sp. NPDC049400 TaxID=3364352 RepID=UPI00379B68B5
MAGLAYHMRHPTSGTVPYAQVRDKMTAEQARQRHPEAFAHENLPPLPPRPAVRRGSVRLTQQNGPQQEMWYFTIRGQTYRAVWRQPASWHGPPTPIDDPAPICVFRIFGLTGRPAELVTELPIPAGMRWREEVINVLRDWAEPYARTRAADGAATRSRSRTKPKP